MLLGYSASKQYARDRGEIAKNCFQEIMGEEVFPSGKYYYQTTTTDSLVEENEIIEIKVAFIQHANYLRYNE